MPSPYTRKQRARGQVARAHAERRRRQRCRNLPFGAAIAMTAAAILSAVAVTLALRAGATGISGLPTFSGLARTT
jgi:hypothetical protein